MAVVKKNIITEGLSGKLGDTIVFRRRDGRTIVATRPETSDRELSQTEIEHRSKFREAVIYAR